MKVCVSVCLFHLTQSKLKQQSHIKVCNVGVWLWVREWLVGCVSRCAANEVHVVDARQVRAGEDVGGEGVLDRYESVCITTRMSIVCLNNLDQKWVEFYNKTLFSWHKDHDINDKLTSNIWCQICDLYFVLVGLTFLYLNIFFCK